ncbi:MAG: S1 RNA-binding domain-containing protein [Planctomycetales bacterium]|nr:S1 RNA-binding domain-containing protein [Planctomycetales bacterium]
MSMNPSDSGQPDPVSDSPTGDVSDSPAGDMSSEVKPVPEAEPSAPSVESAVAGEAAEVPETAEAPDTAPVAPHEPSPPDVSATPVEAVAAETVDAAATEATTAAELAAEAPASESPASEDAPESGSDESAGSNIQIGSRRGDKKSQPRGSRPQHRRGSPAPPPRPTGPVPVPSKRAPLSDDLEQELQAALGGQSVDDLMTSEAERGAETLDVESRVTGSVVRLHGDNVFLSLGGRNEGVASVRQFAEPPEVGSAVEVIVSGLSGEDGLYEVAVPGAAIDVEDWSDLAEGAVVEARVTGSNTGGLECKVNEIRAFIPASQISTFRVENFGDYVDKKLICVVTEANPKRKNLVLSHRAVLEREREAERAKLIEELAVGQIREGTVRSVRDFGAFVDLGGVDGLIHVSQLSWEHVKHPNEVVQEGEKVRVRIEKMDPKSGKIGLSLRSLQEHPWAGVDERFPVGATVTGTVSRIANFGAFVKLAPAIEGLVHVSELAHHRVSLVSSVVKEGDTVTVKILSVDAENQRIGLSIKQTSEAPQKETTKKEEEPVEDRQATLPKHKGPLKGGVDKPSGGEQFGLKW